MKCVRIAVCAVSAYSLMVSATFAASESALLGEVQGKVLVNQGSGFVAPQNLLSLQVGDQVLVGQGATAKVSYKDCTLTLAKPMVYTVAKQAPCAKGEKTAFLGDAVVQPAADAPMGGVPGAMGAGAAGGGLAGAGPLLMVGGVVAASSMLIVANNLGVSGK